MAVPSEHLLVRLVQSIPVPLRLSAERFYDNIDMVSLNMASAFNLTSPLNKGEVKDGIFYGPGVPEIIIADDTPVDPLHCTKEWKNLAPVKVLTHPRSDLILSIPNGRRHSEENAISVIYIHVPMLCLQYRAFRLTEEAITGQQESQLSVMQFIYMYVLPNMMPGHLDIALFNRFDKMFRGKQLGHNTEKISLYMPNYDRQVDEAYEQVLTYLEKNPRNFVGTLQTIPTVTADSAFEALQIPRMMPTRQIDWAVTVARLRALAFLADSSRRHKNMINRKDINLILQDLSFLKNSNALKTSLPKLAYLEVQSGIKSLTDPF